MGRDSQTLREMAALVWARRLRRLLVSQHTNTQTHKLARHRSWVSLRRTWLARGAAVGCCLIFLLLFVLLLLLFFLHVKPCKA